jgi:hypothetical protein
MVWEERQYQQHQHHRGASSAGAAWCNGQRITRLPLLGAPAASSRPRRTTTLGLAQWFVVLRRARGVGSPRAGGVADRVRCWNDANADDGSDLTDSADLELRVQIPRLASCARDDHWREWLESSRAKSRDLHPPLSSRGGQSGRVRLTRSIRVRVVETPRDAFTRRDTASPSSARMGECRAPPGTVAQQRFREHGVAARRPNARRGPDGADARHRDAGATPAGPGTTYNTRREALSLPFSPRNHRRTIMIDSTTQGFTRLRRSTTPQVITDVAT